MGKLLPTLDEVKKYTEWSNVLSEVIARIMVLPEEEQERILSDLQRIIALSEEKQMILLSDLHTAIHNRLVVLEKE